MVSSSADTASCESAQDIIDYLQFAGYEMSRDQLARLHRRRLIDQPVQGPSLGRGSMTTYPLGTAERMLRISQLRSNTKQLDELAWRLWWEGFSIEPELVRAYLLRKTSRWDEQSKNGDSSSVVEVEGDETKSDRDVLEEVFFQHLKAGPAMNAARRQLERGSELYIEFAGLLVDLLRGDLSPLDSTRRELFINTERRLHAVSLTPSAGSVALLAMRSEVDLPYGEIIESLSDEELNRARLVTRQFLGIIANVGDIVQEVFGGGARARESIGKSLVALSESPDEQVLSLLLTSAFLQEGRINEDLPVLETLSLHAPAISYRDFLRLRYLAKEIPGLAGLLTPGRMKKVFETPQAAEEWRVSFEEFRRDHLIEFDIVMDLEPALFDDDPPEKSEVQNETRVTSKKKIQK